MYIITDFALCAVCSKWTHSYSTVLQEALWRRGEFSGNKAWDVITGISQKMDESLRSMCNVSITCLLVCSPHSARLRDSLKTACKNVIFQYHTVKGCFAKPVFSCTRVPSHLCVPPLSFFSHVYTQLMTWRCLIRCCAVFHIVVISRNHPLTHSLQNIYIQTNSICCCRELHAATCSNQSWRVLSRRLHRVVWGTPKPTQLSSPPWESYNQHYITKLEHLSGISFLESPPVCLYSAPFEETAICCGLRKHWTCIKCAHSIP